MRDNTEHATTTPWDVFSKTINADAMGVRPVDADTVDLDQLIDYHRGRLDARARHQLQQRLATSPTLVAELLDLEAFTAAGTDGPDVSLRNGVDVAGAWDAFEARLDRDQAEDHGTAHPAPAVVVDLVARRRLPRPTRSWWVAAAAAVLAVVGLGTFNPDGPSTAVNESIRMVATFEDGKPDTGWTVVKHQAGPATPSSVDAQAVETHAPTSKTRRNLLEADFESLDDWHVVAGNA